MQKEMKNNWVKIALISLTVVMFISVFRVEAEQTNVNTALTCTDEDLALENIDYIVKAVEIWNKSDLKNDKLLQAIQKLTLGTGFENGCLFVKSNDEVELIKNNLIEAGLNDIEIVNALIKRLNKSGYIAPISTIIDVEK